MQTEARMSAALRQAGQTAWEVQRSPSRVAFFLANPEGVSPDEAPWLRDLPTMLQQHGVEQPFVFASGV